ncbi:unnamed protein product [Kuraishia capsulata CBS 1993]|uniref:Meiotically up-regulated protein Msb1/Mug8 domain-containing protein n=1 Tax=Kuraishia capsulata CBS 1993 TaxID=1382522 RepID=W6MVH8_9ASCO|nr:uncharacterized protein KUCA_T00002266001 [Kuraishia capsulata CBS 1993]CDK26295.1 unnamed protein product [Kuraishia capsulata CBS 1993]
MPRRSDSSLPTLPRSEVRQSLGGETDQLDAFVYCSAYAPEDYEKYKEAHKNQTEVKTGNLGTYSDVTFERKEIKDLIHSITHQIKAAGTRTALLILPFRPQQFDVKLKRFLDDVFHDGRPVAKAHHDSVIRATDVHTLMSALKFLWCRLPGNCIIGWKAYAQFATKEEEQGFPKNSFLEIMPSCLSSGAHASIVYDFMDLLISFAGHAKENMLSARKISKVCGLWAFHPVRTPKDGLPSFERGMSEWVPAADAMFHIFLSFLNSMSPESRSSPNQLPKGLQSLLASNDYPPESTTATPKHLQEVPMITLKVNHPSRSPAEMIARISKTLSFEDPKLFYSREDYLLLKRLFKDPQSLMSKLSTEGRRLLDNMCLADDEFENSPNNVMAELVPGWCKDPADERAEPKTGDYFTADVSRTFIDDYFIWTWLCSLGVEETSIKKKTFGKTYVLEVEIAEGLKKWVITEEQVIGKDGYDIELEIKQEKLKKINREIKEAEQKKATRATLAPVKDTKINSNGPPPLPDKDFKKEALPVAPHRMFKDQLPPTPEQTTVEVDNLAIESPPQQQASPPKSADVRAYESGSASPERRIRRPGPQKLAEKSAVEPLPVSPAHAKQPQYQQDAPQQQRRSPVRDGPAPVQMTYQQAPNYGYMGPQGGMYAPPGPQVYYENAPQYGYVQNQQQPTSQYPAGRSPVRQYPNQLPVSQSPNQAQPAVDEEKPAVPPKDNISEKPRIRKITPERPGRYNGPSLSGIQFEAPQESPRVAASPKVQVSPSVSPLRRSEFSGLTEASPSRSSYHTAVELTSPGRGAANGGRMSKLIEDLDDLEEQMRNVILENENSQNSEQEEPEDDRYQQKDEPVQLLPVSPEIKHSNASVNKELQKDHTREQPELPREPRQEQSSQRSNEPIYVSRIDPKTMEIEPGFAEEDVGAEYKEENYTDPNVAHRQGRTLLSPGPLEGLSQVRSQVSSKSSGSAYSLDPRDTRSRTSEPRSQSPQIGQGQQQQPVSRSRPPVKQTVPGHPQYYAQGPQPVHPGFYDPQQYGQGYPQGYAQGYPPQPVPQGYPAQQVPQGYPQQNLYAGPQQYPQPYPQPYPQQYPQQYPPQQRPMYYPPPAGHRPPQSHSPRMSGTPPHYGVPPAQYARPGSSSPMMGSLSPNPQAGMPNVRQQMKGPPTTSDKTINHMPPAERVNRLHGHGGAANKVKARNALLNGNFGI